MDKELKSKVESLIRDRLTVGGVFLNDWLSDVALFPPGAQVVFGVDGDDSGRSRIFVSLRGHNEKTYLLFAHVVDTKFDDEKRVFASAEAVSRLFLGSFLQRGYFYCTEHELSIKSPS
jgi:hypothetical protein